MTREQQCIRELYDLLERVEYGARHRDLTLLRVPRGETGCDMFQGLPPISRFMADIALMEKECTPEVFEREMLCR